MPDSGSWWKLLPEATETQAHQRGVAKMVLPEVIECVRDDVVRSHLLSGVFWVTG